MGRAARNRDIRTKGCFFCAEEIAKAKFTAVGVVVVELGVEGHVLEENRRIVDNYVAASGPAVALRMFVSK